MTREEEIIKLREEIKDLDKIVDDYTKKMIKAYNNEDMITHDQLFAERYQILSKESDIYSQIHTLLKEIVINNDNLDIYTINYESIYTRYEIYLHNTDEKIGGIEFRFRDKIYGDIGYHIYEEYQGHGYAYEALCLLLNFLYKNGIRDVKIRALTSNKPSIKTIEKLESNGLELDYKEEDYFHQEESRSYYYLLEREGIQNILNNLPTRNNQMLIK